MQRGSVNALLPTFLVRWRMAVETSVGETPSMTTARARHRAQRRRRRGLAAGASIVAGLLALAAGSYVLMNARTVQLFGDVVARVDTQDRVVALTFDDGPTPVASSLVELLRDLDVSATFFLTGNELQAHQELGRELVAAGHELGNHSWSHPRMLLLPRRRIAEEIERTDEAIRAAGYTGAIAVRPPYGDRLFGFPRYLADHDRVTIMWDVAPDSDPNIAASSAAITDHVLDNVRPGSIVILHVMYDANEPARQALPGIVEGLRADGYGFVTVSELLEHRS